MTGSKSLSEDEIKLYDRQIRLWGLKAQTNLRNSRILIINLTSVGCEIIKNLMLSGIGSIFNEIKHKINQGFFNHT